MNRRELLLALLAPVLPLPRLSIWRLWVRDDLVLVIDEYHVHSTRELFDGLNKIERLAERNRPLLDAGAQK